MNLRTIDLFAGCGGLSLGFQNAGFDIFYAFDNWKPAFEVYRDNFNHPISDIDLGNNKNFDEIKSLNPDIIIGGPPCQDFSSAGKRDETLGRADLTIKFAEIVALSKPEWFVMENVERIKKSKVLKEVIQILKDNGYGLSIEVLDASYCGVPQARKRFFMIGHLKSYDDFLKPYFNKKLSTKRMSVYDYLGDSLGIEYYYRHPRSYMRRGVFSIYESSPTIRGVNRPIPKNYKKHPGDPVEISEGVRPLTTIERSYIQTFPFSFKFKGTKTQMEQMIGNAVPVKLAEFVGESLIEYMKDYYSGKIELVKQLPIVFETK